jgi:hypothetical protein
MSTPLFFKKDWSRLVPADDAASAALAKIKHGDEVQVEIKRPRNIRHHRKFFALMQLVYQNQEHYDSIDHLIAALKTAVGHCDLVPGKGGVMIALPKSIAFAKMDQTAFDEFYDRCIDIIANHFLPGVDSAALRAEVEELIR